MARKEEVEIPRGKPIRRGDVVVKPNGEEIPVLAVGAMTCTECGGIGKTDYRVRLKGPLTPYWTTWTRLVQNGHSVIRKPKSSPVETE